ncbi:MAG: type III pantothenate kinase [Candidatus Lindowbacteria bacterium]|nr:type III pantothenate kinase [Candidatus Lindowbacteria bacterium]
MNKIQLAVDIGNTETVVGAYLRTKPDAETVYRISTDDRITPDELHSRLYPHLLEVEVDHLVISSVVPRADFLWLEYGKRHLKTKCTILSANLIPDVVIKGPDPDEVGVDRLVNTWIGHRRYKGPLVIVDMGTATTFDVVDDKGAYLGGIISPGVSLFPDALSRRTARLPRVGLEIPEKVIGSNTKEALSSGIVLGHAAMVGGLLEMIAKETGYNRAVATGGLSRTMKPLLKDRFLSFDPNLTIDGINQIGALI